MSEIVDMIGVTSIDLVVDIIFSNAETDELKEQLSDIAELFKTPTDHQDYLDKMDSVIDIETSERLEKYKDIYCTEREAISDEEYERFLSRFNFQK